MPDKPEEKTPPTAESIPGLNRLTEFFDRFDQAMQTWDRDRSGNVDGTEVVQGILKTPKLFTLLLGAIGAVYSAIKYITGYFNQEMDWISMFFGIALIISALVIYLILSSNSKASITTITRLNSEHQTLTKNLVDDHKTHYGGLKQRFVDYKNTADDEIRILHNKIESLQSQKSDIESVSNFRGSVIKFIQEQESKFKNIDMTN